jgi:hypothetical protein
MPPVAMPGLPVVLIAHGPSAAATTVPAPLSTVIICGRFCCASEHSHWADLRRSSWTVAMVSPSSRAISPGWGVKILGPAGLADNLRMGCQDGEGIGVDYLRCAYFAVEMEDQLSCCFRRAHTRPKDYTFFFGSQGRNLFAIFHGEAGAKWAGPRTLLREEQFQRWG